MLGFMVTRLVVYKILNSCWERCLSQLPIATVFTTLQLGTVPRPVRGTVPAPRRPGACTSLRTDALGQGRRSGGTHPARLASLGGHPRHQGRELEPDRRLALGAFPLPVFPPL